MYKLLALEKCVICFVFLVILTFLSCSCFRIDKLLANTMPATSEIKNNPYTSTLSHTNNLTPNFLSALFGNSRYKRTLSSYVPLPRIRHLHNRRIQSTSQSAQAVTQRNNEPPMGWIETIVNPTKDQLNPVLMSRLQRSPEKQPKRNNNNNNNRAYNCQRQDVARKAYLANTVVRAKAESMSSNRVHNYSVTFRILERYKTVLPIDDTLRLTFSSDTKDMNCEIEGHKRPHDLVKAQIEQSKEYFLFLNSHGMHNYSVVGMPVLKKKRNNISRNNRDLEDIKRITSKTFVLKPTKKPKIKLNRTEEIRPGKKFRLICNLRGFPLPYVSWKKDGHTLHSNKRMRISYKKKRTTLLLNAVQAEDQGVYQCIAKGVDGRTTHDEVRVRISNSEQDDGDECKDENVKENYCLNGGTCVRIMFKEIACQCPEGFTGERCGEKDVSNHSSMYGQNTFSCKLGLSTTYYC